MGEDLERIEKKVDFLLSIIVAQQKDVLEATGLDVQTVHERVKNGDVELLSREGSRLNYMTLKSADDLRKTVRKYKRRKAR